MSTARGGARNKAWLVNKGELKAAKAKKKLKAEKTAKYDEEYRKTADERREKLEQEELLKLAGMDAPQDVPKTKEELDKLGEEILATTEVKGGEQKDMGAVSPGEVPSLAVVPELVETKPVVI